MKGKLFALVVAALLGTGAANEATAQRASVSINTPAVSVNVNNGRQGNYRPYRNHRKRVQVRHHRRHRAWGHHHADRRHRAHVHHRARYRHGCR